MAALLLQAGSGGWEGVGHAIEARWIELAGSIGVTVLLVLLLGFVTVAFLRRHRYRAVDVLRPDDLQRLHAELAAAEKETVGEILPVVVERSDAHPAACWVSAVAFVLVGSALLAPWLPWERPLYLTLCQLALGALGYGCARALPDYQRRFIRESRATEMAQEQAFQEFYRNGLHETEGRTGVLLFVSLLEHRVIVLADKGIDAVVEQDRWQRTDRAILEGVARGALCQGLIDGIKQAGEVLAKEFPAGEDGRNEVPDRVVVRRE